MGLELMVWRMVGAERLVMILVDGDRLVVMAGWWW